MVQELVDVVEREQPAFPLQFYERKCVQMLQTAVMTTL
jgi:hypothetical protein